MQHNEHELPQVEAMARELGVDFLTLKTVDIPAVHGRKWIPAGRPATRPLPAVRVRDRHPATPRPRVPLRPSLEARVTLQAGGEIVACEYDYRNDAAFGTLSPGGSVVESGRARPPPASAARSTGEVVVLPGLHVRGRTHGRPDLLSRRRPPAGS